MSKLWKTTLHMLNTSFLDQTSSSGDDNQMTSASAHQQRVVTHMLWLIVAPVLLMLGCFGNVMTIAVMRAMRASQSIGSLSVYFISLAVSDLVLLCTLVTWYWSEMALNIPLVHLHDLSCTVLLFVSYASSMTSAWFLVAMTCQRMMSVILPHRVAVLCTVRRAQGVTAAIVTVSCVVNFHFFVHFRVEYFDGIKFCIGKDQNAGYIFGLLDLGVASIVPFLFLIFNNAVLIYGVGQSVKMSRRMPGQGNTHTATRLTKVSSMVTTLIATSVVSLLLTLPTSLLNIHLQEIGYYEGEIEDERLYERLVLADTICVLMWMSTSAINFYIYILSGRKFREEAKRCLCLCFKRHHT